MNYLKNLDKKIKEYFNILEPNFPEWLNEYINTKEMLFQKNISVTCGKIYSKLFNYTTYYSSLDHSIAVALIIWHFTKDKKQTLSGLFHDIATPAFKHCIDFLNGDYMSQESTEELTTKIIENSKEINALLKKDKIEISEVDDYKLYPIADNDTPKLSADRLEYSLSNALLNNNIINIEKVKEIYNNIYVQTNEQMEPEIGFKSENIAIEFVQITTNLSISYRNDETRYSMQFIADILKKLNIENKITKQDLYEKTEEEIINIIESSEYKDIFNKWRQAKKVMVSKTEPTNVYYVNHGAKVRYIDPLVNEKRISTMSKKANDLIQNNLSYNMNNYVYLDFNF